MLKSITTLLLRKMHKLRIQKNTNAYKRIQNNTNTKERIQTNTKEYKQMHKLRIQIKNTIYNKK